MKDTAYSDNKKKNIFLILSVAIAIALVVIIVSGIMTRGGGRSFKECLDLGNKYLEEMDYEQALAAFQEALKIEPKNADAYLGIVEVYIRTNEFEKAYDMAQKGYEVTGDERLKEKLDMLESGNVYSSSGLQMKLTGYDGEGNIVFWHTFTYDNDGRKTSVTRFDSQGNEKEHLELAYDDQGRDLVTYLYVATTGDLIKVLKEYSEGHISEIKSDVASGNVTGYMEIDLDENGNEIKEEWYDSQMLFQLTVIYEYDAQGKNTKKVFLDQNNKVTDYFLFIYDEQGRIKEQLTYDANDVLTDRNVYIYDEEGNYIGNKSYDAQGNLKYEHLGN